jgi:hypothetical protein
MQLTSIVISTGLALAMAPFGALAWAKAANGVWVASNTWYPRVGNYNNVHESCTRMNSQIVLTNGEDCSYWTNGQGGQGHGRKLFFPSSFFFFFVLNLNMADNPSLDCSNNNNRVECKRGCPDPFSPCQYAETDGSCSKGYSACLQKMGCDGRSGGADCIGTATGRFPCFRVFASLFC